MAEPFKNLLNPDSVSRLGSALASVWTDFDFRHFRHIALANLEQLEFKARAMQIATALEASLPPDFSQAATLLESVLGPPVPFDGSGEPLNIAAAGTTGGITGWPIWSMGEFVARRGLADIPRALACLHALTRRFSAEFAIRPFLDRHPEDCFPVLRTWTSDPCPHVRRLVSEGSRPRLPWGMRLQALVRDPSPTLPLLEALQDDPSSYVRRSVANHLNDIAKDHPDRVAEWVRTHLHAAPRERIALLRHASRHLVKQGHAPTLGAWSLDPDFAGLATLALSTTTVPIGEGLELAVTLQSTSAEPQTLVVDYVVHHRKANGSTSPKVFKGWQLELGARARSVLRKQHRFRVVTTRRLYPGIHRIDVQVNGRIVGGADCVLTPAPG